jgi:hypothetical protein
MPSQKGFWNLYVGFNTESKGMYTPVDASLILKLGNEYNWNAGKINVAFRPIVFNRIRKNWLENLRMLPEKVYNLMDPRGIPYFAIEQSRVKNKDMIYRITGHLSYLNLLALIVSIGAWFTCIAKKEVSNKEFFAFCMTLAGFLYLLLHGYLLEVQSRYSNHLWMMIFWCYPVSQQVVWDNFIKKISWRT